MDSVYWICQTYFANILQSVYWLDWWLLHYLGWCLELWRLRNVSGIEIVIATNYFLCLRSRLSLGNMSSERVLVVSVLHEI